MSDWGDCKICGKPIIESASQWLKDREEVCLGHDARVRPPASIDANRPSARQDGQGPLPPGSHGGRPPRAHTGAPGASGVSRGRTISKLEQSFAAALEEFGQDLPAYVAQYPPLRGRMFRIDFAWPAHKLAVETVGGAHGIERRRVEDADRNNELVLEGWKVLYFTKDSMRNPEECVDKVRQMLDTIEQDPLSKDKGR